LEADVVFMNDHYLVQSLSRVTKNVSHDKLINYFSTETTMFFSRFIITLQFYYLFSFGTNSAL